MQSNISIVNKSELERERIDADFYSPTYLSSDKLIKSKNFDYLSDIAIIRSGTTPRDRVDGLEEGPLLLKTTDIRDFPLDISRNYYHIDESINNRMPKTILDEKDVLLNIVGATLGVIGRASYVPTGFPVSNITQAMALIRLQNKDYTPEYLFAFLLSKYGKLQTWRLARPTGQYNLNLQEVGAIKLIKASNDLQEAVASLIEKSFQSFNLSEKKLRDANVLLLEALGLNDYSPSTTNYSSRSSIKCLEENRFDAEFWQPKYDQLLERVASKSTTTLHQYFNKPIKGIEVGSDEYVEEGIPFIRVSDFTVYGVDENSDKNISQELYEKLKNDFQPQKGELLFTKDGTVGITSVFDNEIQCILSGAFLRLKQKTNADPHYLSLLINSIVCKMQIERLSGGALITHFKSDELAKIIVPVIEEKQQVSIGDEVRESLRLRALSKKLLEVAKQAVEIFVETGEEKALNYIKENHE